MEKVLGITTKKRYEGKAVHSEIFLCIKKRTQDYLLGSFYSYCGAAGRGRTGTIGEDRGILSPLRLPIPPQRHITLGIIPLHNVIVKP